MTMYRFTHKWNIPNFSTHQVCITFKLRKLRNLRELDGNREMTTYIYNVIVKCIMMLFVKSLSQMVNLSLMTGPQEYPIIWRLYTYITRKFNLQELCAPSDFIESISFPTADNDQHRFRLKLFPNGKDEECAGFLSLFLLIQRKWSANSQIAYI